MATTPETYFRSAILVGFAEVCRLAGLDPEALADEVGLARANLFDPTRRITNTATISRLLDAAAARTGLQDLAVRMVERRTLADIGALSLVIREQPTLADALEATARLIRLTTNALYLRVEATDDLAIVSARIDLGEIVPSRHFAELVLGIIHLGFKELLRDTWRPTAICFAHPPPTGPTRHAALFGPRVEFGHGFNGLVFPASGLRAAIPDADPETIGYFERYAEALDARTGGAAQIRERILARLPAGTCFMEAIAADLGVDVRTVQRRLNAEGGSFSSLVQDIRREYAAHYLAHGRRPLSACATLLGFQTQSAFSRWFRTSFGVTPSAWRRNR